MTSKDLHARVEHLAATFLARGWPLEAAVRDALNIVDEVANAIAELGEASGPDTVVDSVCYYADGVQWCAVLDRRAGGYTLKLRRNDVVVNSVNVRPTR